MRPFTVVANGAILFHNCEKVYEVQIGCRTLIFTSKVALFDWIMLYVSDPQGSEKEFEERFRGI
jgi:hypothetical protein